MLETLLTAVPSWKIKELKLGFFGVDPTEADRENLNERLRFAFKENFTLLTVDSGEITDILDGTPTNTTRIEIDAWPSG